MEHDLKARGEEGVHMKRPPRKKVRRLVVSLRSWHVLIDGFVMQYRPLSAFLILFTPEILITFIFASLLYLEFYCVLWVPLVPVFKTLQT